MHSNYKRTAKTSATLISTADMKLYLRVDHSADDALIAALITAAINTAEKQMNLDLLTATYENYRDTLEQDLTLRKGPFYSFTKFEYLVDGSYETLSATEYDIDDGGGIYGKIDGIDLSDADHDIHPKAIKITFVAGYGTTAADIPADILTAIKAHVAYMYENRGDCIEINQIYKESEQLLLPTSCALIYKNYRIIDIGGHY